MKRDKENRIFYRYLELLSKEHELDGDRDWGMIHILGGMQRLISDGGTADPAYESFGFQRYGIFPHSMKYPDGHYDDAYWMMKRL